MNNHNPYAIIQWATDLPIKHGAKSVLVALITFADNQTGYCYPTIKQISVRSSLKERAVQNALKELITAGIITRTIENGKSAQYAVQFNASVKLQSPADNAPRTKCAPADNTTDPRTKRHDTPADNAPKLTNITNQKTIPPYSPPKASKTRPKPKQEFALPDWVPVEAWNGWLEMRRSMKKPATPRAMEIAVKRLAAFKAQGHDPSDILETSTLNNWQGLFAPKSQRPHGQQAASRLSESERNRNIIFEEMRAQYRSQDHANSDRILFQ